MALGDGTTWDETTPVDATTANQIDDYNRDLRKGVRSRMIFEHEWPASQSATSEGGKHKFLTLQNQATKPTVSGTQVAAIYCKTSAMWFEDTAGVEIQLTTGTGLNVTPFTTVFGVWSTGVATSGQAATDLILIAVSADAQTGEIDGYTDTGNPASVLRTKQKWNMGTGSQTMKIDLPVKKNDYWLISGASTVSSIVVGS